MILTLHIALLSVFVFVTTSLMVTAIINRLRIRPVRLSWHGSSVLRYVGWSLASLLVVIGVIVYAGLTENSLYLYIGGGYLSGGVCWFTSRRLASATLVTDFAIIRSTEGRGNVLGWNQVVDFFVKENDAVVHYVFLYRDSEGQQSRFELQVPSMYKKVFKKVVYRCVERKKNSTHQRAYG